MKIRDSGTRSMHVKDLEAAVTIALKATKKAVATLETAAKTIAEADHVITLRRELDRGTEMEAMAARIVQLESEVAKNYAASAKG